MSELPTPKRFERARPRVVIVGGGVGAVEAALALRAMAGEDVQIDLVAPVDEFVFRPLAAAEPFGYAQPLHVPFSVLTERFGVTHHRDLVSRVDADEQLVYLEDAGPLAYRALIIAAGARQDPWLEGALSFGGPAAVPAMRELLDRVQAGEVSDLIFATPAGVGWTLPLYELALLTATAGVDRGTIDTRISIVTTESSPLAALGPAAQRMVTEVLADRGIHMYHDAQVISFNGERVHLSSGVNLPADAVVTLPRPHGHQIEGLPDDGHGFIAVDDHCAVRGVANVYAVGDITTHPVKQGGLAAQQADAAAAAIAHSLGADVAPAPFRASLRGLLLTGVTNARVTMDLETGSTVSFDAEWWAPDKVAGPYLAPFLTSVMREGAPLAAKPG